MVRGWLTLAVALARRLVWVRPDMLTAMGVLVAGIACWTASSASALAAGLILTSALLDGLDGAVAVLSGRDSRFGSVLDSVADRLSDGFFLLALWRAGAPGGVCVSAGAALALLEYTRARAAAVGMSELGVVTVGERPIRVVVCAVALLAAPTAGAWFLLGLSVVACAQLLVATRRALV